MQNNTEIIDHNENEGTEIIERGDSLPTPANAGDLDIHALARMAIETNNAPALAQIMAVRRELREERAKEEFEAALAAFVAECPIIVKKRAVSDRSGALLYRYANLEDIVPQISPLLEKYGLSYSFSSDAIPGVPIIIRATCTLTHRLGYSRSASFAGPVGSGTGAQSEPQKFEGAHTLYKRIALCGMLGILTATEDINAQEERSKPPAPDQKTEADLKHQLVDLTRHIHQCNGPMSDDGKLALTEWLREKRLLMPIETLSALTGDRLRDTVNEISRMEGRR